MEKLDKNNKWIFLIPVDGNPNKNMPKNENELLEDNKKEKKETNKILEEDSKDKNNFKDNTINNSSNVDNNFKMLSYSSLSKSKTISIADSSKLYMSEFLKKNWKIKIKRLILKLKKRYMKQSQKLLIEESNNNISESSNINNIEGNEIKSENNSINFDNYYSNICKSNNFINNCNVNEMSNNYYDYYNFKENNNYNNSK